jgi:hypothetical protein
MVKPLLLILCVAFCSIAQAGPSLTHEDINQIKKICHALIGVENIDESNRTFKRLAPYLASPITLRELHVVCDERCAGLVSLRGDAGIYFSMPNVGHDRIDTVVFHHHGKTLLSIGNDGKH